MLSPTEYVVEDISEPRTGVVADEVAFARRPTGVYRQSGL